MTNLLTKQIHSYQGSINANPFEIKVLGRSKTKEDALIVIKAHCGAIRNFNHDIELIHKKIHWGVPKGQGKRSGGMVKGGMCTIMGTETYEGIDLSDYEELKKEPVFKRMTFLQKYLYVVAFKYGCNHIESMMFAIRNPTSTLPWENIDCLNVVVRTSLNLTPSC